MELRVLPAPTNSDQQVRSFLADGRNWSSSSLYHGSPGRFDTFIKSVRFNEILPHTDLGLDWLELFNAGSDPVELSGCTLTDTMDLPAQWTFPTNSILLPGQFRVMSVSQLPFAFSELGDKAFLLQMAGTNVLRFLDSVDFPAVEREESFGLFQKSDGAFDFTELRANSPGSANALPRVGPVVISEIMFAPAAGHAEFVELANITAAPVQMFDPSRSTNVWRLEGVGNFAFPSGTVLNPCSTLIVCSTNPAAFRAAHGLSESVPVFGPWTGALDKDGETLKLLRPGTPEPDGTVPFYRVDHVSYRTNAPWPQAPPGASLERLPLAAYGNDPAFWRVGPANGTPGVAAANRPPVIALHGNPVVPQQAPLTLTLEVADLDVPWQSLSLDSRSASSREHL